MSRVSGNDTPFGDIATMRKKGWDK